jgi:hypothetical protein
MICNGREGGETAGAVIEKKKKKNGGTNIVKFLINPSGSK